MTREPNIYKYSAPYPNLYHYYQSIAQWSKTLTQPLDIWSYPETNPIPNLHPNCRSWATSAFTYLWTELHDFKGLRGRRSGNRIH